MQDSSLSRSRSDLVSSNGCDLCSPLANCASNCCFFCNTCADCIVTQAVPPDILLREERNTDLVSLFRDSLNDTLGHVHWIRLFGILGLGLGLYFVVLPIPALLSFIPYLNQVVSVALFYAAMICGVVLGSIVIASAYIFHRPKYLLFLTLVLALYFFYGGYSGVANSYGLSCFFLLLSLIPLSSMIINWYASKGIVMIRMGRSDKENAYRFNNTGIPIAEVIDVQPSAPPLEMTKLIDGGSEVGRYYA